MTQPAARRVPARVRSAPNGSSTRLDASASGNALQNRIGIKCEPGRRLRRFRITGVVTAAAAELAERAVGRRSSRKERKADPGVVLEAAVLDRVDRHLELGSRRREPVEHGTEPRSLGARPPGQVEAIEGGKRRGGGTRG